MNLIADDKRLPVFSYSVLHEEEILVRTKVLEIVIPEFPTHVKLVDNKRAKTKDVISFDPATNGFLTLQQVTNANKIGKAEYVKINSQHIYDGTWSTFTRGKVVKDLKRFYDKKLGKAKIPAVDNKYYPLEIECVARNIISHGYISIRNDTLYIPDSSDEFQEWDVDNMGYLYTKTFNDCLVTNGIIRNDTVTYVRKAGGVIFQPVDTFEERCLIFRVYEHPKTQK